MESDMLVNLVKAGGVSALAIGVVYLFYSAIIKLGIIQQLAQWQGFALLCLLAVLVFVVAITVLLQRRDEPRAESKIEVPVPAKVEPTGPPTAPPLVVQGELAPAKHFNLDAKAGVFCEEKNVLKPFASYFDYVNIGLSQCEGTERSESRAYRIDWPQPRQVARTQLPDRANYHQCVPSDFADLVPTFAKHLSEAFKRNVDRVPCKPTISAFRVIRLSYLDLRNASLDVAFVQSFNRGGDGKLDIEQIGTTNLAKSDAMKSVQVAEDGGLADEDLLSMVRGFGYPNVPKPPR